MKAERYSNSIIEDKLNELVNSKMISYWSLDKCDENGNVGESKFRNTEKLTLIFPNNQKLILGTFCSGVAENTCFISVEDTAK